MSVITKLPAPNPRQEAACDPSYLKVNYELKYPTKGKHTKGKIRQFKHVISCEIKTNTSGHDTTTFEFDINTPDNDCETIFII